MYAYIWDIYVCSKCILRCSYINTNVHHTYSYWHIGKYLRGVILAQRVLRGAIGTCFINVYCIYILMYTYTCIFMCIYVYIYIYVYICLYMYIYIYMILAQRVLKGAICTCFISVFICLHIHIYVYMYIHLYVCIHINIYIIYDFVSEGAKGGYRYVLYNCLHMYVFIHIHMNLYRIHPPNN
jgi:hypothetical protein